MKIRPQAELTQAQNRASALTQAESVTRGRFDAALLQAAQGARETEGDAYGGLTPQARQALSEALEELSGKSLDQLKDLEGRPEALAAVIAGLSQGSSLSSAESARLSKLLTLALPRLLQAKSKGGSDASGDVAGGAKASASQPSSFFTLLAGQGSASGSDSAEGASFASVAGALSGVNSGLAGVQGGQAYASPFGASETPASGASVLPVAVNGAGTSLAAGRPGAQGASGNGAPAGVQAGANNTASGSNSGAAQGVQGDGADAEFPLMLDLDVQFVDAGAPLGAQPGTQVTLKGDGTWVYPVSAPTQASKTQPSQGQPQAQETQGASQSQPRTASAQGGGAPESGAPFFGRTASSGALGPDLEAAPDAQDQDSGGRAVAVGNGAAGASDAAQALEDDLAQAAGTGDAPGNGPRSQAAPGQSGAGVQDVSQAQASTQMLGQAPLVLNQGPGVSADQGGTGASGRGFSGRGASQSLGTSSPVPGQNFSAALAALGQNGGQGNGGAETGPGAWPEGGPIPAGIAQAVTQALAQAGSSTPGRLLIQLSPSNLGSVLVDLSLSDGKLTARLVAGQQDVRDALARDLSGFKAGLESHGVVVNEVSVALGASDQGLEQNPQRQAPQNPWRALAATPSREAADTAASAGWVAYGESAAGASRGFSALA